MILVKVSTINNKGRRWCPAISIHHPPYVSLLSKSSVIEPAISRYEVLISLWFSFYTSYARPNHQTLTLTPPEMLASPINLPPSPYDGGRDLRCLMPAKRNLGFQVVGLCNFGPLSCLKSNPKIGDPNYYLLKPRSVLIVSLLSLSQFRNRFLKAFVRRLQMKQDDPLFLWLYKTLPLDSPRICYHEIISFAKKGFVCPTSSSLRTFPLESYKNNTHVFTKVKKTGIMVTSPKGGDYRSFFRPIYPQPLITITIHVQLSYFNEDVHTLKCLELKSGFLLMLQTDYKLCVKFLNLHGRRGLHAREDPPVMLRLFKLSSITPTQTLVKALPCVVVLVPTRTMTLAPSLTPVCLSTMAIRSSIDSLLEDLSIIFDLTCTKKFHI